MENFNTIEAVDHYLRPSTRFRALVPGDKFRFPGQTTIMIKTKSGYKQILPCPTTVLASRTFRTGTNTAVILIYDSELPTP